MSRLLVLDVKVVSFDWMSVTVFGEMTSARIITEVIDIEIGEFCRKLHCASMSLDLRTVNVG